MSFDGALLHRSHGPLLRCHLIEPTLQQFGLLRVQETSCRFQHTLVTFDKQLGARSPAGGWELRLDLQTAPLFADHHAVVRTA